MFQLYELLIRMINFNSQILSFSISFMDISKFFISVTQKIYNPYWLNFMFKKVHKYPIHLIFWSAKLKKKAEILHNLIRGRIKKIIAQIYSNIHWRVKITHQQYYIILNIKNDHNTAKKCIILRSERNKWTDKTETNISIFQR